jgi:hypothetical protein
MNMAPNKKDKKESPFVINETKNWFEKPTQTTPD